MSDYEAVSYGEMWGPYYDDIHVGIDSEVKLLVEYVGDPARALELGVGTGRVAIPLAQAGVSVTGIEISPDMIQRLRAKPGGDAIEIVQGDFAEVPVEDSFPLIYLPFNTLFTLLTQERQVECFRNVAERLEPGGRFVLDTFAPDVARYDAQHTRMAVSSISSNEEHAYEMAIHEPSQQRVVSHHVRRLKGGDTVVLPVTIRYVWPSEMDLMARLAGLSLEHRWDWYDKGPYTDWSLQYVSVYRRSDD